MADEKSDAEADYEAEPEHGKIALFLMAIFMILLVGTWFYTYSILLARG